MVTNETAPSYGRSLTTMSEGLRVGLNWTGPNLVGWDFTIAETLNRLDRALGLGPYARE